jgi:hypothetical protein
MHLSCPSIRATFSAHLIFLDLISEWYLVRSTELSIMQSSPLPCYLVTLVPKCFPRHPILGHPQPMFLSHCERPSFSLIQNNR